MRVISLGKENLDVELSGNAYRICGVLGGGTGFSGFAGKIYKIVEEYPMPMERRNKLADMLSKIPAFDDDQFISNLRDPEFPYTTNLADIGDEEKQWVRETVCEEWERTNPGYDIDFYDEEGNLLCKAESRTRALILSSSCLEIHMDGTIVRFEGELRRKEFVALAGTMTWLCPDERKATEGEFDTYVKKFSLKYKTVPRKKRRRIIFVDDKWKKLYSIR